MYRDILIFTLMITALLITSTACLSDNFQKGLDASQKGDYSTAIKEWTPLAKQGDADAQYALGAMYFAGYGVSQNYHTAVKWYTLAAEQGNSNAQFNLGVMYGKGQGVSQNFQTAMKWYTLAASQGNALAQFNLGLMHNRGQGVSKDQVRAHMWLNLSALTGHKKAAKLRDIVAENLTDRNLSDAQRFARECIAKNYKGC